MAFYQEPGVYTRFLQGPQLPVLPPGIRIAGLIGQARDYVLVEDLKLTKGGEVIYSYNSNTGIITTQDNYTARDTINVVGFREVDSFNLKFLGNGTSYDLNDIDLTAATIQTLGKVEVSGVEYTAAPTPVTETILVSGTGYDQPAITIQVGDTITWENTDVGPEPAHGIQSTESSAEVFSSQPTNMPLAGDTFSHTFTTAGTFAYIDPLHPSNSTYNGIITVEAQNNYVYSESKKEITFSNELTVAEEIISIQTFFISAPTKRVWIILDADGTEGPYDVDVTPSNISSISRVELEDIADALPHIGVTEIIRVGDTPYSGEYTSLDYLLVNDTIEWGGAASRENYEISSSSTESFEDKIFVSVGEEPDVLDQEYILTVTLVGSTGVGKYTVQILGETALIGTYTTSPNIVTPIPGINLIVTDTEGTTIGDKVLVKTHSGTAREPASGAKYYATYKYRKTDFTPSLLFKFDDAVIEYGPMIESYNPDGTIGRINDLTVGAFLAFSNGAAALWTAQTQAGSSGLSSSADYILALDAILAKDVSVTIPLSTDATVINATKSHVERASGDEFRSERTCFVSAPAGTSVESYREIAAGLKSRRVSLIFPSFATMRILDENGDAASVVLDGSFICAAFSGLDTSLRYDVAEPMTNKAIVGFDTIDGDNLTNVEKNRLASAGVCVIHRIGLSHIVRHALTTDFSNVNTREQSITKITDFTAQSVRASCEVYIGKKMLAETPIWVQGTVGGVLTMLVSEQILTGGGSIIVLVDPNSPDTLFVSFTIAPVYPLNYIRVEFSIAISR